MDSAVLKNLVDPAILYFFLGLLIGGIRSNLEIPPPVAKFLSLYLRVEIVVDSLDLEELLRALDRLGVHDHTVVKGVFGHGDRGARGGDPFSGAFDNAYVLVACDPGELDRIVEVVRALLARRGGMCLVSDAWWVRHGTGSAGPDE